MKKTLNFILSVASLVYIVIMALFGLSMNLAEPFLIEFFTSDFFKFFIEWAPLIIIGGFALVNFFGKSLKIIFFLLAIAGIVLYVITFGFPQIFG